MLGEPLNPFFRLGRQLSLLLGPKPPAGLVPIAHRAPTNAENVLTVANIQLGSAYLYSSSAVEVSDAPDAQFRLAQDSLGETHVTPDIKVAPDEVSISPGKFQDFHDGASNLLWRGSLASLVDDSLHGFHHDGNLSEFGISIGERLNRSIEQISGADSV